MLNANPDSERPEVNDAAVERILKTGGRGALVLVVIATVSVIALWLAFYLLVFMPRGPAP